MAKVKNKAPGPRGAWQGATLVMAEPGQVIEADDFSEEWFEVVGGEAAPDGEPEGGPEAELVADAEPAVEEPEAQPAPHPLDHDGDGRKGGSRPRRAAAKE